MQKTAYEMRISERSSDVCSSDLASAEFFTGLLSGSCSATSSGPAGSSMPSQSLPQTRSTSLLAAPWEIGRASCRERVCQYGVDLGGRRIIKHKNSNRMTLRAYL